MSKALTVIKDNSSNPKVWMLIRVIVAGIVVLAEARRQRRKAAELLAREDLGAFIERFDVKDCVTGFGNPDWKKTHDAAEKTAVVVTALLKNGATCIGKTPMDELAFGITGENMQYGTPINPQNPLYIPGGSSSGSVVAVASELVDFALDKLCCIHFLGHREVQS